MRASKQANTLTHEQLQAAIRKFQEQGGIIKKLPDQKTYTHQMVGMKWASLESFEGVKGEIA
jgi:hypothetical protein